MRQDTLLCTMKKPSSTHLGQFTAVQVHPTIHSSGLCAVKTELMMTRTGSRHLISDKNFYTISRPVLDRMGLFLFLILFCVLFCPLSVEAVVVFWYKSQRGNYADQTRKSKERLWFVACSRWSVIKYPIQYCVWHNRKKRGRQVHPCETCKYVGAPR